jgi:iron complex transport system ATP-binding protein
MIRIKQLEIGYSDPLLRVDELELSTGKVYALIGPNGKGKTTFLKTINTLIKPLKGEIIIKGQNVAQLDRNSISKLIAFVSPRFEGIEYLTVQNFILLGRTPHLDLFGKAKEKDLQIIDQLMGQLGIQHLGLRMTSEISDGERQMAAIARAVAQETPIITLDEPTAFLDYMNKVKIIQELKDIAVRQNKCVILSTHDIDLCFEEQLDIITINGENQIVPFIKGGKSELIDLSFRSFKKV